LQGKLSEQTLLSKIGSVDSLNPYEANNNYANPNLNDLNNSNNNNVNGTPTTNGPVKPKHLILNNLNANYTNGSLNDLHRISANHSANVAYVNAMNSNAIHAAQLQQQQNGHNHNNHQANFHHLPAYINNLHPSMKNRNFHMNLGGSAHNSPQTPTFPVDEQFNEALGKNMYKLSNGHSVV
jgi:hypothetical protein